MEYREFKKKCFAITEGKELFERHANGHTMKLVIGNEQFTYNSHGDIYPATWYVFKDANSSFHIDYDPFQHRFVFNIRIINEKMQCVINSIDAQNFNLKGLLEFVFEGFEKGSSKILQETLW